MYLSNMIKKKSIFANFLKIKAKTIQFWRFFWSLNCIFLKTKKNGTHGAYYYRC